MKEYFRQSMAWLHTWAGLVTGWVLFFIFVTGSLAYFQHEITRWMKPELPLRTETQHPSAVIMVEKALDYLAQQPEAAQSWEISLPLDGRRTGCGPQCGGSLRGYSSDLYVSWAENSEWLDSRTGLPLPPPVMTRDTEGGEVLKEMHYVLHYLDRETATFIVAICAMLALLAVVTGIITHKKIFKDFFTFRPGKGQRSWLDAHNVVSVMALPFFLMIVYSGLAERGYMPKPVIDIPEQKKESSKESLSITRPDIPMARIIEQAEHLLGHGQIGHIELHHQAGETPQIKISRPWGTEYPFASREGSFLHFDARTGEQLDIPNTFGQQIPHKALWWLVGAHFAWFAGAGLRWLFFISGLLGCVMIASGLILWTVKRREKYERRDDAPAGLWLVERLNAGVIIGLPVGIAAYFWANRLLPVTMIDRADWEVHCLFLTWGWLLLYALLRSIDKAWVEMLWLATLAFGLIPLLNWLTTDKHLGMTVPHRDWVLAGIDLTMLVLAVVFGAIAWKIRHLWEPATQSVPALRGAI